MTSNVGAGAISEHEGAIGFGDRKSEVDHSFKEKQTIMALESTFAPEFMNRIDDIVIFRALDSGDNIRIVDILLKQVSERLGAMGKKIVFPARIKEHLAHKIKHSRYGARPLKRIVSRYIETPLSDCLLSCRFKEAKEIKVSLKKGRVGFYPA